LGETSLGDKVANKGNEACDAHKLGSLLAKQPKSKRVKHQPALPWQQSPAFLVALDRVDGMGAKAVHFAMLTAARSGEVRGMRWREFDMQAADARSDLLEKRRPLVLACGRNSCPPSRRASSTCWSTGGTSWLAARTRG